MNRCRPSLALLLLGILALLPAAAQELRIVSPAGTTAVFGEVEVLVEVLPAGREAAVELFVDSASQGRKTAPPYRWRVDVGDENLEHTFRAVASGGGEATLTTPAIYVHESLDLKLEQLYVTVTRRGRPVPGLGPEDFRLLDDGVPQTLVTAAAGKTPFTAVVLMDSSVSMEGGRLRRALAGVQAFLEGMEDLDEARVAIFSHELLYTTAFSQDASALDIPVEGLPAHGGTAVYDHLYWALRVLEPRFGRPVVILLSDGEDVHSILDMTEVREDVRRSQAILYWLRIEDPSLRKVDLHGSFRDVEASRRQAKALERSVQESGGRVLPVSSNDAIHQALQEVQAELRAQYALGYYPELPGGAAADGRWHTLEVEVRGAKVRSREGYFAFP